VSDLVLLAATIAVAALVVAPAFVLVRRFRSGEEPVAGGSMGRQLAGREKRSWGPKSAR
jgi:hypothetical protein